MSSLHQGIDLSRFKKIASDGTTSTLKHAKGHEIRIAHKGLSPKMQEHLNNMPVHLADGDPDGEITQAAAEPAQLAQEAPLSVNVTPSSYYPTAQPAQPVQVAQPQMQLVSSPEDDMAEHVKVTHDLATGKIAPETYQSLYGKSDTLGRIGTLFGLLVSGAGSGLAHQSNMVMDMMNKQIDQDLEAQKLNRENKRNFLSLQYQHDLQQAQAAEANMRTLNEGVKGATNAAGGAKALSTMKVPDSENFLKDYMTQANAILTPARAKAKMVVAAANHLDKATQNNPTANAIVKNQVIPAANEQATQGLAAAHEKVKTLGPPPSVSATGRPSVVDENKLTEAIQLGNYAPQGTPGAIPPHDIAQVQKEKGEIGLNRNGAYDWNDSFNNLANMSMAGQIPGVSEGITGAAGLAGSLLGPLGAGVFGTIAHGAGKIAQNAFERQRNIQKEALRQRLGTNKSDASSESLIDSLLPAWNDTPESIAEAHRKGIQHFKSLENSPALDTYANQIEGLKSPFPNLPLNIKKKKGSTGKK